MGPARAALEPAVPVREPVGAALHSRGATARLFALAAALGAAACAGAPPGPPAEAQPPLRELPPVICQPCGQMQPTAYVCSGKVMIRSDVPARRVPELTRYCAEKARRGR
jgi:hypothetical protein